MHDVELLGERPIHVWIDKDKRVCAMQANGALKVITVDTNRLVYSQRQCLALTWLCSQVAPVMRVIPTKFGGRRVSRGDRDAMAVANAAKLQLADQGKLAVATAIINATIHDAKYVGDVQFFRRMTRDECDVCDLLTFAEQTSLSEEDGWIDNG
jgi:hypothetical protein